MPDTDALTIWTVYRYPSDYPDKWVLRASDIVAGGRMTLRAECVTADTLDAIRASVPPGLYRMHRFIDDDPVIYEVWL